MAPDDLGRHVLRECVTRQAALSSVLEVHVHGNAEKQLHRRLRVQRSEHLRRIDAWSDVVVLRRNWASSVPARGRRHYWRHHILVLRRKVTGNCFHMAIGLPSLVPGTKRHFFASRIADWSSLAMPLELISFTSPTRPSARI